MIHIIEIFSSVQGETSLAGLPTVFIRLARCNLRCRWCDTTYSFGKGIETSIDTLVERVEEMGCRHVCVTGGEPLLQRQVHLLMRRLCDLGKVVSLETGGSLSTESVDPRVRVILDVKCPGSGMEKKNLWENLGWLKEHDEVKFVIADRKDYDYALKVCKKYKLFERNMPPLLSPVHGEIDPKQLVEWMLEDQIFVRLNLQQHKYIWTPETIGV